jgi:hypothetical protein
MSKRIPTGITREYLEAVALPNHGGRYTPISHKSIIDKVHEELAKRGFNVESELYRASIGGNVANGIYILDQGTDPDMKMMFVWGNSYDKSMRFKCGVGVYIPKTGNYIFAGNISSYARKHTGKADEEAIAMIQTQLNQANAHYTDLLASRDILINQTASIRTYSELVGRMFIEKECLNKEQASSVRDRLLQEVSLLDDLEWNNAWNFYNSVATALRMSHPKNWFEDQSDCHKLITNYFEESNEVTLPAPVQNSAEPSAPEIDNQLTIFDVIETKEEAVANPVVEDLLEETVSNNTMVEDEFSIFGDPDVQTFELPDL